MKPQVRCSEVLKAASLEVLRAAEHLYRENKKPEIAPEQARVYRKHMKLLWHCALQLQDSAWALEKFSGNLD